MSSNIHCFTSIELARFSVLDTFFPPIKELLVTPKHVHSTASLGFFVAVVHRCHHCFGQLFASLLWKACLAHFCTMKATSQKGGNQVCSSSRNVYFLDCHKILHNRHSIFSHWYIIVAKCLVEFCVTQY